jgi:hypothetical protein
MQEDKNLLYKKCFELNGYAHPFCAGAIPAILANIQSLKGQFRPMARLDLTRN